MPTERFYRLPETKRKVIREAAKKEFARVPYEKASINQIIQNADISRGSFYTYFEDKQDILRYLLEDSRLQIEKVCEENLEESRGDYLKLLERLFDFLVKRMNETKDMMEIAQNVFFCQENARMFGLDSFPAPLKMMEENSLARRTYNRINRSLLKHDNLETVTTMILLGSTALMYAVRQYYEYPDQLETIRRNFRISVEMLRCGAYRDPN